MIGLRRTSQPRGPVPIDWSNPLTRGLVFCAVPIGPTFIDLVTGELGTPSGTVNSGFRSPADGRSRLSAGYALSGNGGTSSEYVSWPVSLSRGGAITSVGAIFALGGTTEQVDGNQYMLGGNTEVLSFGHGFSLGIDSYNVRGRGNVLSGTYLNGNAASIADLLGNPFHNRTHFFGYSFSSNGANGTWFGDRRAESWSGSPTFGTTTTNRKAYVLAYSSNATWKRVAYALQLLIYSREVSLEEYQALYDNPWQLFAPMRRIWVPPSSAPAVPAITAVSAENITATSADYRVTLDYA